MPKQLKFSIGLPFSGKSTLAAWYQQQGWKVVSRDELLHEIITSEEFNRKAEEAVGVEKAVGEAEVFGIKNRLAIQMLNQAVRRVVQESKDERIFFDGTNLQRQVRKGLTDLKNDGVEVSAVYLRVPIETILERAKTAYQSGERQGSFNHDAFGDLFKMIRMFEEPDSSEGIPNLEVIEPSAETKREFVPEFSRK